VWIVFMAVGWLGSTRRWMSPPAGRFSDFAGHPRLLTVRREHE
jgi:hypothetical protein